MNMKPDDLLFPSSFSGTEHCWVLRAVKVQVKHMQITFSVTIRIEDTRRSLITDSQRLMKKAKIVLQKQ